MTARFQVLPIITKENIDLDQLANSFVYFIQALFYDRGLDKVAPLSEHELEMCAFMAGEHPDWQPPPKKRGVCAFRGSGKSTMVAAGLPCYRYLRDPNRQILEISKSDNAAKKTLGLTRKWMNSVWFLQHLQPRLDQDDNKTAFYIGTSTEDNRQPSMTCMGIGGQIENNRAHTFLADDVETKANSKTLESREHVERMVSEGVNILYPDRPHDNGGPVDPTEDLILGTVKHAQTLYKKLADKGYVFMTFPIEYPEPTLNILNLAGTLKRRLESGESKIGQPTFPHRFGIQDVAERKSEGRLEFLMEHMCVVGIADTNRYPLRLTDMIVFDVNRHKHPMSIQWGMKDHNGQSTLMEQMQCLGFVGDRLCGPIMFDQRWMPYIETIAYVDPAGSGEDEVGLCIASTGGGYYWVHGVWGFEDALSTTMRSIATLCREHNARTVYYEGNVDTFGSFGTTLSDLIAAESRDAASRPLHPDLIAMGVRPWSASVVKDHACARKETRIISTLEPVMSTHRLVIHPDALRPVSGRPIEKELQHQLAYMQDIPNCLNHDDRADVLASAIGKLIHAAPTDRTEKTSEGVRMQRMIEKFNGKTTHRARGNMLKLW